MHSPARSLLLVCLTFLTCSLCLATDDADLIRSIARAQIPLEKLVETDRGPAGECLQHGSIFSRGPVETFPCHPAIYRWLLDQPHLCFQAWRALGVKCARVERQPDGSFLGGDSSGSEVRWRTVLKEPERCMWLAEGSGRPLPFVPGVSLRALLVLHHREVRSVDGRVGIRHRAEMFATGDGKAMALAIRLSGFTAEAAARKTLEQIEMFFSGMAWYFTEHPAWALDALQSATPEATSSLLEIRPLLEELRSASQNSGRPASQSVPAAPNQR